MSVRTFRRLVHQGVLVPADVLRVRGNPQMFRLEDVLELRAARVLAAAGLGEAPGGLGGVTTRRHAEPEEGGPDAA